MNRVLITGLGVVCPVGNDRDAFWDNLTAGRSGVDTLTLFDASTFPVRIGGEVKRFDPSPVFRDFPEARDLTDRKVLLALAAARETVRDAGLPPDALENALLSIGIGLEFVLLEHLIPFAQPGNNGSSAIRELLARHATKPMRTPLDSAGEILGRRYGLLAGRYTHCAACAASSQAIGEAFHLLRDDGPALALVGGTDCMLNPVGLGGFSLLRVLSEENDTPQRACRPFDATRVGTVLGEGAAFLLLETEKHALARKAPVYAEVIGYSSSLDAHRVSDPDPDGRGAALCMSRALRDAALVPDDVDCVNAHATGTVKNDGVETAAIKRVLGKRAYEIPVHAVKSMTGHIIAACGAIEAVAASLTISRSTVPPTINLRHPDPDCDLAYVPDRSRPFTGDTVISNSFAFGGHNAALVFRRYA